MTDSLQQLARQRIKDAHPMALVYLPKERQRRAEQITMLNLMYAEMTERLGRIEAALPLEEGMAYRARHRI